MIPAGNPDMLLEDIDEKSRFLRRFESDPEDKVRNAKGRILLFLKRLRH